MAEARDATFTGQLGFAVQWLKEFNTPQRAEFLPVLVECFLPHHNSNVQLPIMSDDAQPEAPITTVVQWRMKTILNWVSTWTHHQKCSFIKDIRSVDPDFIAELLNDSGFTETPEEQ